MARKKNQSPDPQPDYLTPAQVAALTGLHLSTIKREIARGNLVRVKIGGSNRIPREAFAAYVAARTTGGAQ
jgi:excisionase family DNA binding protein